MTYDAVVFDSDGVLVTPTDRETVQVAAEKTFTSLGVRDPGPDAIAAIADGSIDEITEIAMAYELVPNELWRARERAVSQSQRELIDEGGKRFYTDVGTINRLTPEYRLAVVSNNQQATVEHVARSGMLTDALEAIYGRPPTIEGLRRMKPNPAMITTALEDLDTDRALYIGDQQTDIEAARAAGIDAAYLQRSHNGIPTDEPAYVIESLWELPELLGEK